MIYDLIIIGGGPAAIAAGIFAARKKIKTLLIADQFGGQFIIAPEIQNFIGFKSISGLELNKKFEEHLRAQTDIEIKDQTSVSLIEKKNNGFKVETNKGEVFETKTVLLTSGKRYRKLNIPGENEFEGKGVFYCATCDAPLMKNKTAAVVGGGNSGFGTVVSLLPYASKIYILESAGALTMDPISWDTIKSSGKAEIITSTEVKEIFGDKFVKGLKYEDTKTGEMKELAVDGIFISVGYVPNSEIAGNLAEINQKGEIIIDFKTQKTSCDGLWAAGDVTDSLYKQIGIAIGDGTKAILNIYDSLKSK